MESLILAIVVGVGFWLLIDQGRKRRAARAARPRPARDLGTMPRLGTPGTITPAQIQALKSNDFTPDEDWSREEAALVLDGLSYARAVLAEVTGRRDHDLDVQNQVYAFVLRDPELRDYLRAERPTGPLPRNAHFEQVAAFVRRTVG